MTLSTLKSNSRTINKMRDRLQKLSASPGVYVFCGGKKEILYVGKATNLKSRVGSYFQYDTNPRINANQRIANRPIEIMIHEVVNIKTIETESVLEALILESNLIKKYQPKYNVKEKDDKSFSYFVITKEDWPKVVILRKTDLDVIASEDVNDSSQRSAAIPLQQSAKQNIKTGVLRNGIATPACRQAGKIKIQDDNAKLKNKKILDTKYQIPYTKIYGPYTSKKQMEIALKIVRKIFPFHSAKQKTEKGCLDFQIGTCPGPYAGAITKKEYRQNIRGIQMILAGKKKGLIRKLEMEMREYSDRHEYERAGEIRNRIYALNHIRDIALISEEKNIPDTKYQIQDTRIEAYDISNISGQYAVGSMVVFRNGEPDKTQYRKFKIKSVEGSDDVGMMREVLYRRFNNDWRPPDLILLDGGQGHANMVGKILSELNLEITAVSVAKGKTRKNLNFQFPISNKFSMTKFSNEIKDLLKDKNLIKRIMDEAHRFAIGYHRKLRRKNSLQ